MEVTVPYGGFVICTVVTWLALIAISVALDRALSKIRKIEALISNRGERR